MVYQLLQYMLLSTCNYQMYRIFAPSNANYLCFEEISLFDGSGNQISLTNHITMNDNDMGCVDGNHAELFGVPDGTSEVSFASGKRLHTISHAFDDDSTTHFCTPDRYDWWRCGAPFTSPAYSPLFTRFNANDYIGYTFTQPTTISKFSIISATTDTSLNSWKFQGCSTDCDTDSGYNSNWFNITDSATVGYDFNNRGVGQEFSVACGAMVPVQISGASANQDPHLVFANRAIADFRGSEDGIFNFITYPKFSVNIRTQASQFFLRNVTVDGTFITELYINAITDSGKTIYYSQSSLRANENNWGWKMSNGTCNNHMMHNYPHMTSKCDEFIATTDASTTTFYFRDWKMTVTTNHVYNHISGAKKRLDIKVEGPRNEISHGILGQSFNTRKNIKNGLVDVYPNTGHFRTYAQAEGSIEGNYKEYAMSKPFSTDFRYSVFTSKGEKILSEDTKLSASVTM